MVYEVQLVSTIDGVDGGVGEYWGSRQNGDCVASRLKQ
jgi:hypothetical protein